MRSLCKLSEWNWTAFFRRVFGAAGHRMFNRILNFVLFVLAVLYIVQYQQMSVTDCAAAAQAQEAPVSVRLDMPDPNLNTDLSYSQITQKFRNAHKGLAGGYAQALGVTEFAMEVYSGLQFVEKMKSFSTQACLVPEKVEVMTALKQTIFLGNSSTRSRCQFKTLMEHEMRHVAINRDVVRKHVPQYEAAVREGLAAFGKNQGWGPYDLGASEEKKRLLNDYMEAALDRAIKATEREINSLQSRVDTPQEYMRIGRACDW